jgi:O-antigen/teichoic acid export membrane protein
VYGAAAQLGALMALVADAFVKAFNPWLFRRLQDERPASHLQVVGAMYAAWPAFAIVGSAMCALLVVGGPAMLGPTYHSALHVLPWFMLGGAFSGAYLAVSGLYFFHNRTALLSSFSFPCAALGLAVTMLLVRRFGVAGAAAGYAFTQGLLACFSWWVARRYFGLPWRPPRPALAAWLAGLRTQERRA